MDNRTQRLAQVIADSFFAMEAGESWEEGEYSKPEPNAGDMQLAHDILMAGYALSSPPADDVREALANRPRITQSDLLRIVNRPGGANDQLRSAMAWGEGYAAGQDSVYTSPNEFPKDIPNPYLGDADDIDVRPYGTVTDTEVEAVALVIYQKDAAIYGWPESFAKARTSTRTRYYHVARAALEAARNA